MYAAEVCSVYGLAPVLKHRYEILKSGSLTAWVSLSSLPMGSPIANQGIVGKKIADCAR